MDTTEVEVQKVLAELAGVPVEVLKVKVTMLHANALDTIRSRKARTAEL